MTSPIDLSIIIPAYNEARAIEEHLRLSSDFIKTRPLKAEILVVDDGSRDSTAALVEAYAKTHPEVRLIRLPKNSGKGCAVRTGILAAVGKIRGFTDADGATPIAELDRILPHFKNDAEVVIGSRAKKSQETHVDALIHRRLIGRVFNFLLRVLINVRDRDGRLIRDTQCGFKWFSAEAAQVIFSKMTIDGFAFDVEALYLANRMRLPIVEQPVNWTEKGNSKVKLWRDPVKMFWQVSRIRRRHR